MQGMIKKLHGLGLLHNYTCVHHRHTLRHFGDHTQVMCDKNNRGTHLLAHIPDQIKDLSLNGHIQCRAGFVGDQQFGDAGQRHGDHHALCHTAGKFMGE